ncbi:MAG: YbjN domain-containing protein [Phenylobacterium sp.]
MFGGIPAFHRPIPSAGLVALALAAAPLTPAAAVAATPAKAPAPKTSAPRTPAFDARRPPDVIALLAAMEAKAEIGRKANGQVFMTVTTPGGGFGAQMVGCDEAFATCRAIALYSAFSRKGVTMAQINDYNRSQLTCRGIMTPSGEPSVMYAVLLNGRMTRDELREHVGVWQGCLSGFGEFIQDPIGFLSRPQG